MRYRNKSVVIEAYQFTSQIAEDYLFDKKPLPEGLRLGVAIYNPVERTISDCKFGIETLEGFMTADFGDWIIKGIKGEFYPCKPDIFEATYEKVDEQNKGDVR